MKLSNGQRLRSCGSNGANLEGVESYGAITVLFISDGTVEKSGFRLAYSGIASRHQHVSTVYVINYVCSLKNCIIVYFIQSDLSALKGMFQIVRSFLVFVNSHNACFMCALLCY